MDDFEQQKVTLRCDDEKNHKNSMIDSEPQEQLQKTCRLPDTDTLGWGDNCSIINFYRSEATKAWTYFLAVVLERRSRDIRRQHLRRVDKTWDHVPIDADSKDGKSGRLLLTIGKDQRSALDQSLKEAKSCLLSLEALFRDSITKLRMGESIENLPLIDPDVSLQQVADFITANMGEEEPCTSLSINLPEDKISICDEDEYWSCSEMSPHHDLCVDSTQSATDSEKVLYSTQSATDSEKVLDSTQSATNSERVLVSTKTSTDSERVLDTTKTSTDSEKVLDFTQTSADSEKVLDSTQTTTHPDNGLDSTQTTTDSEICLDSTQTVNISETFVGSIQTTTDSKNGLDSPQTVTHSKIHVDLAQTDSKKPLDSTQPTTHSENYLDSTPTTTDCDKVVDCALTTTGIDADMSTVATGYDVEVANSSKSTTEVKQDIDTHLVATTEGESSDPESMGNGSMSKDPSRAIKVGSSASVESDSDYKEEITIIITNHETPENAEGTISTIELVETDIEVETADGVMVRKQEGDESNTPESVNQQITNTIVTPSAGSDDLGSETEGKPTEIDTTHNIMKKPSGQGVVDRDPAGNDTSGDVEENPVEQSLDSTRDAAEELVNAAEGDISEVPRQSLPDEKKRDGKSQIEKMKSDYQAYVDYGRRRFTADIAQVQLVSRVQPDMATTETNGSQITPAANVTTLPYSNQNTIPYNHSYTHQQMVNPYTQVFTQQYKPAYQQYNVPYGYWGNNYPAASYMVMPPSQTFVQRNLSNFGMAKPQPFIQTSIAHEPDNGVMQRSFVGYTQQSLPDTYGYDSESTQQSSNSFSPSPSHCQVSAVELDDHALENCFKIRKSTKVSDTKREYTSALAFPNGFRQNSCDFPKLDTSTDSTSTVGDSNVWPKQVATYKYQSAIMMMEAKKDDGSIGLEPCSSSRLTTDTRKAGSDQRMLTTEEKDVLLGFTSHSCKEVATMPSSRCSGNATMPSSRCSRETKPKWKVPVKFSDQRGSGDDKSMSDYKFMWTEEDKHGAGLAPKHRDTIDQALSLQDLRFVGQDEFDKEKSYGDQATGYADLDCKQTQPKWTNLLSVPAKVSDERRTPLSWASLFSGKDRSGDNTLAAMPDKVGTKPKQPTEVAKTSPKKKGKKQKSRKKAKSISEVGKEEVDTDWQRVSTKHKKHWIITEKMNGGTNRFSALMTERSTPADEQECSICFEDFTFSERFMLKCGHDDFHFECVSEWVREQSAMCPKCRKPVDLLADL